MTEKPECERFVRPVVISPPPPFFVFCYFFFFLRHPEVPAFFVQFDGPACALSRTSNYQIEPQVVPSGVLEYMY